MKTSGFFTLFIFFALFIQWSACAQNASYKNINQKEFVKIMHEQQNAIVIDVRTPAEYRQGFIQGTQYFINFNDNDFEKQINELDKSKTYLVYCRSGSRSADAARIMTDNGFKDVYNLNGGYSQWTGTVSK